MNLQELPEGEVVITTTESGECVAVTRQDEEGMIIKVLWERKDAHVHADVIRKAQAQALREAAEYFDANTWHNVSQKLRRMADELESKT